MDLEEYIKRLDERTGHYKGVPDYSTSLPMPESNMYYYFKVLTGFINYLDENYYLYKCIIEIVKIDDDAKKICHDNQIAGHKKRTGNVTTQQPEIKVGDRLDYFLTIYNMKKMISQVSNVVVNVSDERLTILEDMSNKTGEDFDTLVKFEKCVNKIFGVRGYFHKFTNYSFRLVKCPICGGTDIYKTYGDGKCVCKNVSCNRRLIPLPKEVGVTFACGRCGSGKTVPWYTKESKCTECGYIFKNEFAQKYKKPAPKTKKGPIRLYGDDEIIKFPK